MMLVNEEAQHDLWRHRKKNKREGREIDNTRLKRPNYQALVIT
jgi:hypothetical protein